MPEACVIINPHLPGQTFFWQGGPVGVLLSHGFGATTAEVRPLAKILHQAGLTVSGPLLPGHFDTVQAINRCRWQDWAAAYQSAFIELAQRCEAVFVGGESMGALLALHLAAQAQADFPEIASLRGVLTYAPVIQHKNRLAPALSAVLHWVRETAPKPPGPVTAADVHWQGYSRYGVPAAHQMFILQKTVRRELKRIQAPILVIQGDQDRTVGVNAPEQIRRIAVGTSVEIHRLNDCGHCILLEGKLNNAAQITLSFIAAHTTK